MTEDPFTILVVEDDDATRTFLADNLTADGYELLVADCAREGRRLLEQKFPDAAVVDVGLPDGSGLDLVREVREADGTITRIDPTIPMLLLSGRADEIDRVRGIERGADDFLGKPYSYAELRARLGAMLRRAQGARNAARLRVGPLLVDSITREVTLDGERVPVSQKEFLLLRLLASEPARVFSKQDLLRSVWGFEVPGTTRTVDSHACRLRRKLEGRGDQRWILNVWGVGYRLTDALAVAA